MVPKLGALTDKVLSPVRDEKKMGGGEGVVVATYDLCNGKRISEKVAINKVEK